MKRLIGLFFALAIAGTPAQSGMLPLLGAGSQPVAAASYSGPGDIVSGALAWHGLRAYSAATRGTAAINVCNVSDVACGDLSTDATTGALVIGLIGGSSCAIVTCTIKTMYDQTGNGVDVTNATIATRPTLLTSCIGSLPCAVCVSASTQFLVSSATVTSGYPYSLSVVAENNSSSLDGQNAAFYSMNSFALIAGADTGTHDLVGYYMASGTKITRAGTINSFHAMQGVTLGANSSAFYVDGSSTTSSASSITFTSKKVSVCQVFDGTSNFPDAKFTEGGVWSVGFSAGDAGNMNTNQHNYWGF